MAENPRSQIIAVTDLEWKRHETLQGIRQKALWSDPATQRRAVLSRFEPGATLPLHRHAGDEILYVIEGAIADEAGTVSAGNMGYRPDGCVHNVSSKNGATVLAVVTGGVEPAKELGGGARSQIFAVSEVSWRDTLPGVRQKLVWEDKAANRRAILALFEPGSALPRHRHTGEELLYMIEGSHADETGEVATGNMSIRPNGCTHSVNSRNGAISLAFLWGGIEMV
ncbi:MAG TPA: cupin domain-containing protein [Candidatus Binataceae bacterium]|jgi:anti-sigma factor ChrR (cupin superfamily)|nr:cupin domain-containing protein [Candidatus Binataceae bacterium]